MLHSTAPFPLNLKKYKKKHTGVNEGQEVGGQVYFEVFRPLHIKAKSNKPHSAHSPSETDRNTGQ